LTEVLRLAGSRSSSIDAKSPMHVSKTSCPRNVHRPEVAN
jgi:hypothetical protein